MVCTLLMKATSSFPLFPLPFLSHQLLHPPLFLVPLGNQTQAFTLVCALSLGAVLSPTSSCSHMKCVVLYLKAFPWYGIVHRSASNLECFRSLLPLIVFPVWYLFASFFRQMSSFHYICLVVCEGFCMSLHVCTHTTTLVWRSEFNLWELPCESWGLLVIRFGGKCCYPVSHVTTSHFIFIIAKLNLHSPPLIIRFVIWDKWISWQLTQVASFRDRHETPLDTHLRDLWSSEDRNNNFWFISEACIDQWRLLKGEVVWSITSTLGIIWHGLQWRLWVVFVIIPSLLPWSALWRDAYCWYQGFRIRGCDQWEKHCQRISVLHGRDHMAVGLAQVVSERACGSVTLLL